MHCSHGLSAAVSSTEGLLDFLLSVGVGVLGRS